MGGISSIADISPIVITNENDEMVVMKRPVENVMQWTFLNNKNVIKFLYKTKFTNCKGKLIVFDISWI